MLVEMHMLKDYKTRVTGNYEALRGALEIINRDAHKLVQMNRDADAQVIAAGKSYNPAAKVVLRTTPSKETVPFEYKGFKYERTLSPVSGAMRIEYTHEPVQITIPRPARLEPALTVTPPRAYIVPAQWTRVIDVLEFQGVKMMRTSQPWSGEVETYRCHDMKWNPKSFEGHHVLFSPQFEAQGFSGTCDSVHEKLSFPAGSVVVPLDQRSARVAIEWLEPEAPDSAVAWGFFDAIFEQKEDAEAYVLEKLAPEIMAKDPKLKQEFEDKVANDKNFAGDPSARLSFFYQRSPWWDTKIGLYPVGQLTTLEGLPLK
jgi:hypothetical protein